jgi:hypothetical protein
MREYDSIKKEDIKKLDGSGRKNSIGNGLDLLRRSRFNSRADELKINKIDNQDLMNELVNNLGSDIQFYQCYKLDDDEKNIISTQIQIMLESHRQGAIDKVKQVFSESVDKIACEKFIAVGYILDNMYSMNPINAKETREIIMNLYREQMIDADDIKHG